MAKKKNNENLKIGLVYIIVFIIASIINLYNGYNFNDYYIGTLLATLVFVSGTLLLMNLFRKLEWFKFSLIIGIILLLKILNELTYITNIQSALINSVYVVGMYSILTIGLVYILDIKTLK